MKITKRQLRKIITEEITGTSAQLMTDEQLLEEGLLDFLGGLFKKMTGALKKVVDAGVKALNPGKEANTHVAKAAEKISKKYDEKIEAETIGDLDLENENHHRVLGMSQIPYSKVVSAEALDLFKQADAVKDWTPKSDSEEDNEAWMDENEEGITALMKAAGTVLGMLRYYYDEIDLGGGERISQFQKAADSFPDPDPAAVCKWTMDACEDIVGFFGSIPEAKPMAKEYVKIYKAAEAIGKKVAASAKEQQKEWAMARRAVGEILNEDKMKITKSKVRSLIKEAVLKESMQALRQQRADLLKSQYEEVSSNTSYPYGRYRGDVRRTTVYKRMDGQPVPDADFELLKNHDKQERIEGGSMAALGGINTTTVSDDGLTMTVKYYRHTAG